MQGRRVVVRMEDETQLATGNGHLQRMIEDLIDRLCLFSGPDRDSDVNEACIRYTAHLSTLLAKRSLAIFLC